MSLFKCHLAWVEGWAKKLATPIGIDELLTFWDLLLSNSPIHYVCLRWKLLMRTTVFAKVLLLYLETFVCDMTFLVFAKGTEHVPDLNRGVFCKGLLLET